MEQLRAELALVLGEGVKPGGMRQRTGTIASLRAV